MLLVDTVKGELIDDDELKEKYATKQPYGEWLDNNLVQLHDLKIPNHESANAYKGRESKTSESIWIYIRRFEDIYSSYGA